jgi:hypothetical protein
MTTVTPLPLPTPSAPLSWGELIDKITILDIKNAKLTEALALANVRRELVYLIAIEKPALAAEAVRKLKDELRAVNGKLWDVEDHLRDKERAGDFGTDFVELARSVYRLNDQRAAIKKRINGALASELVEEKSYTAY